MSNSQRWRAIPPRQVDYPDLLQAIRDELGPVQSKLEELNKQVNQLASGAVTRHDLTEVRHEISTQMLRVETRYYSKELVDARLALQDTTIQGIREEIKRLGLQIKDISQRPSRALNMWVAIASIIGGTIGGLAFIGDHLGLVIH